MKSSAIVTIPIEQIKPDPENLRQTFDEADLKALAENILAHGQMDPIHVFRRDDGFYDLWDGERRWRASKIAKIHEMSAIVIPKPSPVELLCKKISRAMQTRNLTFPEEVGALEQGLRSLGVYDKPERWAAAAKKLGVPPSLLRQRMKISRLSGKLRKDFEDGTLDLSTAQALGEIENHKKQEDLAGFIVKESLNNRFAVLQFIPMALEHPKKPLLEAYDLARERERHRYGAPRKKEEVPPNVVDSIDDMLADFRKCQRWLEFTGREDLIHHLLPDNFNTKRLLSTFRTLHAMLSAFLSAYARRSSKHTSPARKQIPLRQLLGPGSDRKDKGHQS